MIEIRELRVRFGRQEVLKGITLDVRRNEILGVIGPAQSGKTTLLKVINRTIDDTPGAVVSGTVLVDGTPFKDRQMIVALGIGVDGRKTVLGLREGATENATVVSELLSDLAGRGLNFSEPRLYVLDGGKALAAAVRRHAGAAARIQRCQIHKRRNVLDHLPEEHRPAVKKALQNAYAMTEYADAKRGLERLHRELMDLNPSAARSLEEGLEETLTVHRLRVPLKLRRTLASTNVIESAFSIVETVCRNVKRWHGGDQIERWVGSGLLVAERKFRKVRGYREIPSLMAFLNNAVSKKPLAKGVAAA